MNGLSARKVVVVVPISGITETPIIYKSHLSILLIISTHYFHYVVTILVKLM
jgi:hypothetical protein